MLLGYSCRMTVLPDDLDLYLARDREPFESARWKRRDAWAFAAMDTMPQIAERVLGIVGEGRVMNTVWNYVHRDGLDDLSNMWHQTGMRKGGHDAYPEGHSVWQREEQAGFTVYLTHGRVSLSMEGFGVGVVSHEAPTEKEVRARHDKAQAVLKAQREARKKGEKYDGDTHGWAEMRNITIVDTKGFPGEPGRDDRIEIKDWNEHGVLRHTIVTFVEPDWPDSGRVTETNYVVMGHYKDTVQTPGKTKRYPSTDEAVIFARFEGPDADLDAARAAEREVSARPDTDFVWLAEEQVTRVRNSI